MNSLTIISHTEHFRRSDGTIVGLGSTVTEINHLLDVFDEIIHVAMLHHQTPPTNCLPYVSDKIKFMAIPALGGPNIADKFGILLKMPLVMKTVMKAISKSNYFQFRAPTGIGLFLIPYLVLFSSKKGWFKYAGNWNQKNGPLAYSFQRWCLKNQKRYVTINGQWPSQPIHCLSFENPCITSEEFEAGQHVRQIKNLNDQKLVFCFVGRLEKEKGLDLLIKSMSNLDLEDKNRIQTIHIVGEGESRSKYESMTLNSGLDFKFHGLISRKEVHDIYIRSHSILLPSLSEGFPKVLSEAMNYGCIPIASKVSSIPQYIDDEINGFLFYPITSENFTDKIKKILNLTDLKYAELISAQNQNLTKFTYLYYNKRIKEEILEL